MARADEISERSSVLPPLSVTSNDVARAAGVSQATVSRAFHADKRVAPDTRQRVLDVAARLGYMPSELGRSLVTRSTRTIAIVVTDLPGMFAPEVIAALHDEATDRGYRTVLFTDDEEAPVDGLRRLLDRSIDGAVLTTTMLNGKLPRELVRRGLPVVFLARYVDGMPIDSAVVDNSVGAYMITSEVTRVGHRRVGAIFGPENTSTGRDRERGTRSALRAAGVVLADNCFRRGSFQYDSGHRNMLALMAVADRPTAVICSNDVVAIGALNAAHGLGMRVPEDVSVVGFDDLPMAAWEVFQLTTVRQPTQEMAREATRLLIERIEGRSDPQESYRTMFEPVLVVRRTLGPPS